MALPMGAAAAEPSAARPNILFILTDDQGWADFSAALDPEHPEAHCPYFETPHMDCFIRQGMRFTDAYSPAPICTPTRRSIQYGMTPARQCGTEFLSQFDGQGHRSIAQYIKQVDPVYRCAIFGKWGEAMSGTWDQENVEINPAALGYDESDGPHTGNVTGTYYHWKLGKEMSDRNYSCEADPDPKRTFSVTKRAISFMERQAQNKQPFYLQVNYYAIHTAQQALQKTMDKYAAKDNPSRKVLRGVGPMLEDLDCAMGQLMDALDSLGLADNTYVFLSSDNGGEQAWVPLPQGSDDLPDRNAPLRGVKGTLYEGGIRVPFAVHGPGIQENTTCREPVALYDLLPTFYELAGGSDPLPADIDGASLRPLLGDPLDGAVQRTEPGMVFHRPLWKKQFHSAIRMGDYKLVLTWSGPWEIKERELFNLATDIGETQNLAAKEPERADGMTKALLAYLKKVDAETAPSAQKTTGKK
jgi:arylsulfatase A-like enzyme